MKASSDSSRKLYSTEKAIKCPFDCQIGKRKKNYDPSMIMLRIVLTIFFLSNCELDRVKAYVLCYIPPSPCYILS